MTLNGLPCNIAAAGQPIGYYWGKQWSLDNPSRCDEAAGAATTLVRELNCIGNRGSMNAGSFVLTSDFVLKDLRLAFWKGCELVTSLFCT